ncbi:MAG: hypothetical protein ACK4HW_04685 [Roseinatronobacter sp.]
MRDESARNPKNSLSVGSETEKPDPGTRPRARKDDQVANSALPNVLISPSLKQFQQNWIRFCARIERAAPPGGFSAGAIFTKINV